MSRYQLPAGRPLAPVVIQQFRGVDFSSDSTQVDVSRSPDALNMIADQAFFPIKRTGYKRVAQGSGRVWGLHRLAGGGGEQLLTGPELLYICKILLESKRVSCSGRWSS